MPSKICDRSPCDTMRKAMVAFLQPSNVVDTQLELKVLSKPSKKAPVHYSVLISYCPFCGTRIDPHWVKEQARRK